MTEPIDPTGGQTPVSTLAELRTVRTARKVTGRRAARKVTPAKRAATSSRAESAAKRGKYADRIVGAIKSGAGLLYTRKPLQAQILIDTADEWGAALDRVAAEDKRVDAFLQKVSGWFGKSSAWGDLGAVAAKTGAALLISSGVTPVGPAGMAVAFLGGALVEQGIQSIASTQAAQALAASGWPNPEVQIAPGYAEEHARLTVEIASRMIEELRERPVADNPTPTTAIPDPGEEWPAA